MALNPFFLQGSSSEQRLIQQLINEQLKIYGVDVTYIPRKFVKRDLIFTEIQSSKFDDNYTIEAYVNTYEGYSGAGDLMTKFGVSIKDELTVTISKERFEDFISPFLEAESDSEIVLSSRPREGDLIYFPFGQRLFEVKFVEHEQPFYQLGKTYVYELKCELFEYEDEVVKTSVDEIDSQLEKEGFITTLNLIGVGITATASAIIDSGYVRKIFLNNDGSGYTSTPSITFSASPATGGTATAVAITTSQAGVRSIHEILLTKPGFGYTTAPTISITGGGGVGGAATCSIEKIQKGVVSVIINSGGAGYSTAPSVSIEGPTAGATATATIGAGGTITALTITNPGIEYIGVPLVSVSSPGIGTTAIVTATISGVGTVSSLTITNPGSGYTVAPTITISNIDAIKNPSFERAVGVTGISTNNAVNIIRIRNPGIGYTVAPSITIANPPVISGIGAFEFNEIITGSITGSTGIVKEWDSITNKLKISMVKGLFAAGEVLVGSSSSAVYSIKSYDKRDIYDKYSQNDEIEEAADLIVDFSESNPFGVF